MTAATPEPTDPQPASPDPQQASTATEATLELLDEVLISIAERHPDTTPQWEFCEGFMTALLCMRRTVTEREWLHVLFSHNADTLFASPSERTRFLMAWMERESQLRSALQLPDLMQDELPQFDPAITDWRGMLAKLTEAERAKTIQAMENPPPALGQIWASGFMSAVLAWPEDWTWPRNKALTDEIKNALKAIASLTSNDTGEPTRNLYETSAPPSVSAERLQAFGKAMDAVATLYDIAHILGPRVPQVRHSHKTGRNDPCPCGSGKKYKKCCGASASG
ncbi:MAG: UPF0149 family protein [Burkholderiaceae bacterium]|jgi:uncharacterized protein|nr:UPF0149 family protein [Burkholderiaceae bacterium]